MDIRDTEEKCRERLGPVEGDIYIMKTANKLDALSTHWPVHLKHLGSSRAEQPARAYAPGVAATVKNPVEFHSRIIRQLTRDTQCSNSLRVGSTTVEPVVSVINLGVYMGNEMNMRLHIGKICSACYFHLRRLRQLRHIVSKATMKRHVSAFVLSRLDYCNSVLAGLPDATLALMQRVMNAAVRLVACLHMRDHVTSAMRSLHWLPIKFRVRYKIMYLDACGCQQPQPRVHQQTTRSGSTLPERERLRSSTSGAFVVPVTKTQFGRRAFSVAGPAAWNELPTKTRYTTDIDHFKRALKAPLFSAAYVN